MLELQPTVKCVFSGDRAVLLDIARAKYFSANHIASEILGGLEAGSDIAAICDTVASRYDVPRERLEADVESFLKVLEAHNIIRHVQQPTVDK